MALDLHINQNRPIRGEFLIVSSQRPKHDPKFKMILTWQLGSFGMKFPMSLVNCSCLLPCKLKREEQRRTKEKPKNRKKKQTREGEENREKRKGGTFSWHPHLRRPFEDLPTQPLPCPLNSEHEHLDLTLRIC